MMKNLLNAIQGIFSLNNNTQHLISHTSKTSSEYDLSSNVQEQMDCNYANNYYGDQYCQTKTK